MKLDPGPQLTADEIAAIVWATGQTDWNAINCVAVILAESAGYSWARPVVSHNPASPAYLSVDRGICQFNSYWFSHIPDRVAYDPLLAIPAMVEFAGAEGRWSLDFSLWSAYANESYIRHLGTARHAINRIRETNDLEPV